MVQQRPAQWDPPHVPESEPSSGWQTTASWIMRWCDGPTARHSMFFFVVHFLLGDFWLGALICFEHWSLDLLRNVVAMETSAIKHVRDADTSGNGRGSTEPKRAMESNRWKRSRLALPDVTEVLLPQTCWRASHFRIVRFFCLFFSFFSPVDAFVRFSGQTEDTQFPEVDKELNEFNIPVRDFCWVVDDDGYGMLAVAYSSYGYEKISWFRIRQRVGETAANCEYRVTLWSNLATFILPESNQSGENIHVHMFSLASICSIGIRNWEWCDFLPPSLERKRLYEALGPFLP